MIASRGSTAAEHEPRAYDIRIADGEADAKSLTRLWDHYFGVEYDVDRVPWPAADIAGWVDDDQRFETLGAPLATRGVIAEHDGVRIGGGIVTLETREYLVEELPDGAFDASALACDRNAWLVFGAVDPAWRGHGIGRRLFAHRLGWARTHGAQLVVGMGWERDERPSSRPLFESYGFQPVEHFPGFYADSDRWQCPDCGVWKTDDAVCECSATLWALDVSQEGSA